MQRRSDALVDVMQVPVDGDAKIAIIPVGDLAQARTIICDILIVGGGTGGVAAALAAARSGKQVHLIEETDWIGGQLTAQGVSALDEHDHIENFGGSASYYALRKALRDHYRPLAGEAGQRPHFNPGNCWVTRVAFEPRAAVTAMTGLLQPHMEAGRSTVHLRTKMAAVETDGDRVVPSPRSIWRTELPCISGRHIVLDATELGESFPWSVQSTVLARRRWRKRARRMPNPSSRNPTASKASPTYSVSSGIRLENGTSSTSLRATKSFALRNPTACASKCTAARSTARRAVGYPTRCSSRCRAPRVVCGPIAA